jgi:phosphoglycolate phosphatase-like HAD superfamily hydrolase
LPSQYREAPCLFLDCDGVIFDSNGFKLEAMRAVLAEYPRAAVEQMEQFWSANGGMSRQKKFHHFFERLQVVPDAPARIDEAIERFGQLSREAFVSAKPIPEALLLARDAGPARTVVVSGADQAELRDIFAEKGLSKLVGGVYGSPTSKLDHVARILREHACPPGRALFIGDGGGDFEVCRTLGVPFVYLAQFSDWRDAARALDGASDTARFDSWPELLSALSITEAPA